MSPKGVLARMFQEGINMVPTHRTGNLLQELETRQLTDEEERIIQSRVELQRRMLAAFEKQEALRKREQLREVHPDLTDEEADRALELCNGREDEAADRLSCDMKFLRTVVRPSSASEVAPPPSKQNTLPNRPVVRRPLAQKPVLEKASCEQGEQVFVGVFRSRSLLPDEPEHCPDNVSEPMFDSFRNVPRQLRSKTKRQRRQIAPTIETSTETCFHRAAILRPGNFVGAPSDDSAELTVMNAQCLQVNASREQEAESPLKESKEDQIAAKLLRFGVDRATDSLRHLPNSTVERVLSILRAQNSSKAALLQERMIGRASSSPEKECCSKSSVEELEAPSSRPKRKAAINAVGFSKAILVKSDSDTETDDDMYGQHHAKRRRQTPLVKANVTVSDITSAKSGPEPVQQGSSQEAHKSHERIANTLSQPKQIYPTVNARPRGARAISVRGHTNRGRVRQKSHKSAELVTAGILRLEPGWHNQGYIFPEGFKSRVNFRSSVELDQLCVHECSVLGEEEGEFWPQPTFKVVAMDRPEDPLIAKSCTGCWTGILKRINGEIETRRKAGENLPPPPKTAIAGPEYFGFNQQEVSDAVEALDPNHLCDMYWQGKTDRQNHAAGLPIAGQPYIHPKLAGNKSKANKSRRSKIREPCSDEDTDEEQEGGQVDEATNVSSKWSAISRYERYKQRCGGNLEDKGNPLPGWVDPITLEPVVNPAISPFGHIMGMATWKAVLSENGKCPFTKRPLKAEQCQILTKINITRFASRIIADKETLQRYGLSKTEEELETE